MRFPKSLRVTGRRDGVRSAEDTVSMNCLGLESESPPGRLSTQLLEKTSNKYNAESECGHHSTLRWDVLCSLHGK